jgi:hypothetical protein
LAIHKTSEVSKLGSSHVWVSHSSPCPASAALPLQPTKWGLGPLSETTAGSLPPQQPTQQESTQLENCSSTAQAMLDLQRQRLRTHMLPTERQSSKSSPGLTTPHLPSRRPQRAGPDHATLGGSSQCAAAHGKLHGKPPGIFCSWAAGAGRSQAPRAAAVVPVRAGHNMEL